MMSEDWIILSVAVAGFVYVSGIVLALDAVVYLLYHVRTGFRHLARRGAG